MSDPLDDFLSRSFEQPPDDRLRREILEQTTRVLRRRRITRTLSIVTALAACFLVGVGVGGWLLAKTTVVSVPVYVNAPTPNGDTKPVPVANAVAQENKAFDARENRAELYFEAGRKYMRETQDFDAALRCYRQALSLASADALNVSADDDWLLMSLKQSRQKENSNAVLN